MKGERHVTIAVQRRGRIERFELPLGPLRVGSASYCDVRLGPDEAAPEHLAFEPQGNGLCARALSSEPAAELDGAPLDAALIDPRGTIKLGDLLLSFEVSQPLAVDTAHSRRIRKLKQVGMLLMLALMAYYALYRGRGPSALQRSVTPTPLFDARGEASCRHRDREAARAFAEEQRLIADSKRERSAFHMHDGVLAVPLYEQAAACFALAGEADAASEAREAAARLIDQLETELHAHEVRLEFFLARGRYPAAEREVVVLRELLAGRDDRYGQWLSAVARELRAALSQPKKG